LHKAAKEHNEPLRNAFMACIGYGYSEINTKAVKKVVFLHGKWYIILPALTLDAINAIDIMENSCIKLIFKEFVITQVLPQMNTFPHARSVLILNNARIHHDDGLLEYLNAFSVRVEFLPPYSTDLNPIELAFSIIKNCNRDIACNGAKYEGLCNGLKGKDSCNNSECSAKDGIED
ncbi:30121_t:CDS:2, partial [Gigaspora margarita]